MPSLDLTPDELLSTTRAVRRRLDFERPIERSVLEACLALAQQAPTGSNRQHWHFVVVTDQEKRAALADIYRRGWDRAIELATADPSDHATADDEGRAERLKHVRTSALYLVEHMHEVPVHVVPCITGRTDGASIPRQAGWWGSIVPAMWSFMLAARSRGLGSCLTTVHLHYEEEAAEVLGIPFSEVMQAALIPVAYTRGTDFNPAPRAPLEKMVRWEGW